MLCRSLRPSEPRVWPEYGPTPRYAPGVEFEWDPNKASSNLEKHGVPFDELPPPSAILYHSPLPIPTILTTRNGSFCWGRRSPVS